LPNHLYSMSGKSIFKTFLLLFVINSIAACRHPQENKWIVGVWDLQSWMAFQHDSSHYPYGENAAGQIIYHPNGRMSFMLSKQNRDTFGTFDRSLISAEQGLKANNSFFAYWGTYVIDESKGQITHEIYQSLLPDWSGKSQKRYFKLNGDTLILTSDTIAGKTHHLVWIRRE
jgi:hypothetical protein